MSKNQIYSPQTFEKLCQDIKHELQQQGAQQVFQIIDQQTIKEIIFENISQSRNLSQTNVQQKYTHIKQISIEQIKLFLQQFNQEQSNSQNQKIIDYPDQGTGNTPRVFQPSVFQDFDNLQKPEVIPTQPQFDIDYKQKQLLQNTLLEQEQQNQKQQQNTQNPSTSIQNQQNQFQQQEQIFKKNIISDYLKANKTHTKVQHFKIDSGDRGWMYQQQSNYQYTIRFNAQCHQNQQVSIYQNNQYVPKTRQYYGQQGTLNQSGFIYNGNNYPPYDPSKDAGEIIGYESIFIQGTSDINILKEQKNVCEIKFNKLIIAKQELKLSNSSLSNSNFIIPYISIVTDNFDSDVYLSSNKQNVQAIMIFDKEFISENGRSYVVMRNSQDEKKSFYPKPLSSLNYIDIKLLRPDNTLVNQTKDSQQVISITYDFCDPNMFSISLQNYFDKDTYVEGDIVQFSNIMIYQVDSQMNQDDIDAFNQWIQSSDGHQVFCLRNQDTSSGKFRSFNILIQGYTDPNTGIYIPNQKLINVVNQYNQSIKLYDPNSYLQGSAMNKSSQHNLFFQITSTEHDSRQIDVPWTQEQGSDQEILESY